jgi:hypothetical protein
MPTQTTSVQEAVTPASQPSIGEIFSKRAANMNRLLSRREKDGGAHRRAKSRDKSADKKVKYWEDFLFSGPHSYWLKPLRSSQPVTSLCAAFPGPHGKSAPLLQLTQPFIRATTANSRPGFFLQTRPLSGDGIMGLFKSDTQKKNDKDQENTNIVHLPTVFLRAQG